MSRYLSRSRTFTLAAAGAAATGLLVAPTAVADEFTGLVINEVYPSGSVYQSSYSNDFVELYNPTDETIDLSGLTLQVFLGRGGNHEATVELEGAIAADDHFLVQFAQSGSFDADELPTPDQEANADFTWGASAIVLTDQDSVWTEGDSAVDIVGWGDAPIYEGSPAEAPGNFATSLSRDETGTDTDNNSADFAVLPKPTPQPSQKDPYATGNPFQGSADFVEQLSSSLSSSLR